MIETWRTRADLDANEQHLLQRHGFAASHIPGDDSLSCRLAVVEEAA